MPSDHDSTSAPPPPAGALGSRYGRCGDKPALARETSRGNWQVKTHDPTNRLAGHDGWLTLGTGWATLSEACDATGLS